MNMQQIMAQAQKMQREMQKKQEALASKEFTKSNGGGVTVTMTGARQLVNIDIDEDLLDKDSKDMLQDMIKNCINDVLKDIEEENNAIQDAAASGIRF
ncbi:MAG: YbaB/EbfC family nucleoid-associated protein [Bacilli bacterium]|nr:YbaB/EbfC family nucleoid-associated protein [Bacilli bacterium]